MRWIDEAGAGNFMTIRTLLMTALCVLPGAAVVGAEYAAPVAVAPAAEAHPYFADMPYPAWSRLTAEQALKDAPVAMQIASARLEAIRSLQPQQMSLPTVSRHFSPR